MAKLLPIRVDDLHLSPKEIKFVAEYTSNGFDAERAIKESGLVPPNMSPIQVSLRWHELLQKDNINTAIDRMNEAFIAPYRNRLLSQMIARLQIQANYILEWYYYADGTAKPLSEISPERQMAIVDTEVKHYGKDGTVTEVKYKLADQEAARKALKEMLDKKEGVKDENTTGMRARLAEIFNAAKMGIDYGRQLEQKLNTEAEEDIDEEPENIVAPPKKRGRGRPRKVRDV